MSRSWRFRSVVLVAVLALVAVACGDDDDPAGVPDTTAVTTSSTVVSEATTSTTSTASISVPGEDPAVGSGVHVVTFVDDSRPTKAESNHPGAPDRTIETRVYLPSSPEPRPLIVLSHGHGGHPDKLRELSYHWSDAGFVVAAPKFPLSNHEVIDPSLGDVPAQAADVAFVVDSLQALDAEGGATAGRIDFDQIGLAGVSLGGITNWSTLMSGCCENLEIDGMVVSDTAFPADSARVDEVTMPVLTIHSDVDPIFPYEDVRGVWDTMPAPRWLLTLHGAPYAQASENDDIAHADVYQLASTEFWERVFGEDSWDDDFPPGLTSDGVSTFETASS